MKITKYLTAAADGLTGWSPNWNCQ